MESANDNQVPKDGARQDAENKSPKKEGSSLDISEGHVLSKNELQRLKEEAGYSSSIKVPIDITPEQPKEKINQNTAREQGGKKQSMPNSQSPEVPRQMPPVSEGKKEMPPSPQQKVREQISLQQSSVQQKSELNNTTELGNETINRLRTFAEKQNNKSPQNISQDKMPAQTQNKTARQEPTQEVHQKQPPSEIQSRVQTPIQQSQVSSAIPKDIPRAQPSTAQQQKSPPPPQEKSAAPQSPLQTPSFSQKEIQAVPGTTPFKKPSVPLSNIPSSAPKPLSTQTSPQSTPAPPQATPKVEEQKPQESLLPRLRTYKGDVAEAVKKQKASLASITAAEQERKTKVTVPTTAPAEKKQLRDYAKLKKILITSLSIFLVVLGVSVVGYFLFFYDTGIENKTEQEIPSLVFINDKIEVDITNKNSRQILQMLSNEKERVSGTISKITQLYLTIIIDRENRVKELASSSAFLSAINAGVSDSFKRALNPIMTIGVHIFNGNQPFIVFTVNSYQRVFAGMLGWEDSMHDTLSPFFGEKLPPLKVTIQSEITSTSTVTGGSVIKKRVFEDVVIKNIDARILKDDSGKTVLLYTFLNQKTLIITTNENTLSEIITRINTARVF